MVSQRHQIVVRGVHQCQNCRPVCGGRKQCSLRIIARIYQKSVGCCVTERNGVGQILKMAVHVVGVVDGDRYLFVSGSSHADGENDRKKNDCRGNDCEVYPAFLVHWFFHCFLCTEEEIYCSVNVAPKFVFDYE